MLIKDKAYFKSLFEASLLKSCLLVEAPLEPNKWELLLETTAGKSMRLETRRGEPRRFVTIEAATRFAHELGFRAMRIKWGSGA